ncbi:MAG: gamma-glutamylcyclotransferase, partial [Eudoraea sp.]|nr:gamma-glutamylcyclotransferase [Eudoraea sp.]
SVQHSIFNRILSGQPDSLRGYQIATDQVAGRYPLIERSSDNETEVQGTVYELSGEDLLLADSYEGNAYKRIKVRLHSEKDAWVYIRNS